ncbi:MAG: hypothetical protein CL941_03440 [Desulfobacter sp.]|jgi:hypothetical protein|nr:hypothetical protein [Desulfobacter sp.]|tara:strand:+ start:79099 stop:79299 length:201 start_codon:yes stop_codon:yes gene_type:complete
MIAGIKKKNSAILLLGKKTRPVFVYSSYMKIRDLNLVGCLPIPWMKIDMSEDTRHRNMVQSRMTVI